MTAMAAESALQVVEKLQARLAANPDPKKVSEWAARSGRALGGRGPVTVVGPSAAPPGQPGPWGSDPEPGPAALAARSREVPALGRGPRGDTRTSGGRASLPPGRAGAPAAAARTVRAPRVRGLPSLRASRASCFLSGALARSSLLPSRPVPSLPAKVSGL